MMDNITIDNDGNILIMRESYCFELEICNKSAYKYFMTVFFSSKTLLCICVFLYKYELILHNNVIILKI